MSSLNPADPIQYAALRQRWAESGRGARLGDYWSQNTPTPKSLRSVYAAIGERDDASRVGQARAEALGAAAFAARSKSIAAELAEREASLSKANPRLDFVTVRAMAGLAGPTRDTAGLGFAPGSLAPLQSAAERAERFFERRSRKDWARETRAEFGGPIFSDPLLLSLLRRAPPAEALAIAENALSAAVCAGCVSGALGALALGADPMSARQFFDASGAARANLLGHALSANPQNPTSRSREGSFNTEADDALLGSATLALAVFAPVDLPAALGLLARGAKAPRGWRDALGLCLAQGLLGPARLLIDLGMDPLARSCGPRPPASPTSGSPRGHHPLRADLLASIFCKAEADALGLSVSAPSTSAPAKRAVRL